MPWKGRTQGSSEPGRRHGEGQGCFNHCSNRAPGCLHPLPGNDPVMPALIETVRELVRRSALAPQRQWSYTYRSALIEAARLVHKNHCSDEPFPCTGCGDLGRHPLRAILPCKVCGRSDGCDFSPKSCRACGKKIVFLQTARGKTMPIDASSYREGNTVFSPSIHVSHFSTCTKVEQFRKESAK